MNHNRLFAGLMFLASFGVSFGVSGLCSAGEPEQAPQKDAAVIVRPELEWLEYGAALQRAQAEDKHILVDFYTSWCGWCKVMDRKTYTDERVIKLLTESFVIAKINAESAQEFAVGDDQKSGRQLAKDFGVQSFPMTWFLKPDGKPLVNIPGFVPPEKFARALEYVGQREYLEKTTE